MYMYLLHWSISCFMFHSLKCVCKDLGGEKKQVVAAILAENEAAVNKEDVRKVEEEGFRMFELPNIESAALVSVAYSSIFTVTLASFNIYPKIKTFLQVSLLSYLFGILYYCGIL